MRRLVASALFLLAIAGAAVGVTLLATSGPEARHYWITMDNAFGLVNGSDVKLAGVRAGNIVSFDVDRRTHKALVEIDVNRPGFELRRDAYCETRPQSLIGEYFLDCEPGTSPIPLPVGGRLPVTQTGSTVPLDLLNDLLRVPQRQRLSLFLDGIGAGLAGRGADLSATIRRAVPALREFDQVLAILAQQNHTVADLDQQADTVITALAQNRRDVARWVVQTGRAAHASADQRVALAQTFQRFPAFLQQLTPTMRSLGQSVVHQTPALQNLYDNAGQLTRLLSDLGPFANASLPAVQALGRASQIGRQALPPARPVVSLLKQVGVPLPEVSQDLAIVLHDLDDRARATEPDPRSPGGKGFTGLEALLEYARNQALGINAFDQYGYVLRASIFTSQVSQCSDYTDAQTAKAMLPQLKGCVSWLGPDQPGITMPDPTLPSGASSASDRARGARSRSGRRAGGSGNLPLGLPAPSAPPAPQVAAPGAAGASATPGAPAAPTAPGVSSSSGAVDSLINYLMAP